MLQHSAGMCSFEKGKRMANITINPDDAVDFKTPFYKKDGATILHKYFIMRLMERAF